MSQTPLTSRVRTSVGWNIVQVCVRDVLVLVRAIVVARLLVPDDLGLFGMAATVMGAIRVLTNMNLYSSIVANKFADDAELYRHLDTVWTAELVRRLLVTLLLCAAAYPTALFYGDKRLYAVLPVLSLLPLISAFNSKGLTLLRKKVQFGRIVLFEITNEIVATAAVIGFAFWTRNVWAIVWSQVLSAVVGVFLSYRFSSHRPRLMFDRDALKLALNYGKYMVVIAIMTYVTTTADNIFVGRLFGAGVLGTYVVAYSFASLPAGVLHQVLSNVMFPAYSELKASGGEKLEMAFVRSFAMTATLLVIVTVPLFVLSEEIVRLLFGEKWDAAGPILRVLTLLGFFRGLVHTISPFILGINRPDREAKSKTVEAILFLALLYPLTANLGTVGAAWAGVIVYFVTFLNRFWFVRSLYPAAFRKISRDLVIASLTGCVAGVLSTMAVSMVDVSLLRIPIVGFISTAITTCVMLCAQPDLRRELASGRIFAGRMFLQAKKQALGG